MSHSARTALTTGILTLAALAVAPGCTGILGLNAGKASDGSLGAPCDINTSDNPTLCQSGATCALHVCRANCASDSDCQADERCIVADNGGGGGAGGSSSGFGGFGSSSGFGGFGSSSGSVGASAAGYGCVPLTAATCSAPSDCGMNRTCDSNGQCRTNCVQNCTDCGPGCASGQSCNDVGGTSLCYGPHDSYVPDGSTGDDGSSGGTSSSSSGGPQVACTGSLKYGSCAQCVANCSSCVGCSGGNSGYCSGAADSCATCGSLYGCTATSCPDCVSGSGPSCTGTPTYDCSSSFCQNSTYCTGSYPGYCQGCTWTPSVGSCTGGQYACSTFTNYGQSYCQAAGCVWSSFSATCSGTATPCSGFTDAMSCGSNLACSWSSSTSGICTGTVSSCSNNTSQAGCSQVSGCTWNSSTSCSGTPMACSSLGTASQCQMRKGCSWTSTGASSCTGTITPCGLLSASSCTSQPGCTVVSGGGSSGAGGGSSSGVSSSGGSSGVAVDAGSCATVYPDGATACNCLTPTGPTVSVTTTSSMPTFTGGVVQPGTYVLQSEQAYAAGLPSGVTVESVQDTIQITGTSFQRATNVTSNGPAGSLGGMGSGLSTTTGTFRTGGSIFSVNQSCPGGGIVSGSYSASPGTLTLETHVATDAGITVYFIANYTLGG